MSTGKVSNGETWKDCVAAILKKNNKDLFVVENISHLFNKNIIKKERGLSDAVMRTVIYGNRSYQIGTLLKGDRVCQIEIDKRN